MKEQRAQHRRRIVLKRYRDPRQLVCFPSDCWHAARHRKRFGPYDDVRVRRAPMSKNRLPKPPANPAAQEIPREKRRSADAQRRSTSAPRDDALLFISRAERVIARYDRSTAFHVTDLRSGVRDTTPQGN